MATKTKAKEPWQMTETEYVRQAREWRAENMPRLTGTTLESELAKVAEGHKGLVRQAIGQGKPVPPEVLKDYPDLKPVTPEVTKPAFIVDTEGKIARVTKWDAEGNPTVVYPGKSGGIVERTGLPFEYKPEEGWRVAKPFDFTKAIRPSRSAEMIELRMWQDEFGKVTQAEQRPYPMSPQERRRAVLEARIKRGESVPEKLLAEFPDLKAKPTPITPEPKAEKGKAEAQARYKELMKPRLEAHDKEIEAVNDDFMAGKMTRKEMEEKHKAIHKKTDGVAATMRKKAWGEYPETLPSREEIEKVQRMRSPRSQASDLAQQHSVVISPDSPKVAMWLHDQGRADISGVDTPRLTRRAPRITPKRPRLKR